VKRAEKATRIADMLGELYPNPPVPLDHHDAYSLLVAVMLSAQTTDKKVNEVTPSLFALADTPAKMAAQRVEDVRTCIRTLGLAPQKAANLVALSQRIVDVFDHQVPETYEGLESLPGVGHKTASVVMAQWFGHPAFPVDTHIHRLAARWGLSDGTNVTRTERDLKGLFPASIWNDLHVQMIMFGREHCPALYHDLDACPICAWAATKKRKAEELAANAALRQRGRRAKS